MPALVLILKSLEYRFVLAEGLSLRSHKVIFGHWPDPMTETRVALMLIDTGKGILPEPAIGIDDIRGPAPRLLPPPPSWISADLDVPLNPIELPAKNGLSIAACERGFRHGFRDQRRNCLSSRCHKVLLVVHSASLVLFPWKRTCRRPWDFLHRLPCLYTNRRGTRGADGDIQTTDLPTLGNERLMCHNRRAISRLPRALSQEKLEVARLPSNTEALI